MIRGLDKREDIISYNCMRCKNLVAFRSCKAFKKIPLAIWNDETKHDKPIKGDKGIQFELRKKYT